MLCKANFLIQYIDNARMLRMLRIEDLLRYNNLKFSYGRSVIRVISANFSGPLLKRTTESSGKHREKSKKNL